VRGDVDHGKMEGRTCIRFFKLLWNKRWSALLHRLAMSNFTPLLKLQRKALLLKTWSLERSSVVMVPRHQDGEALMRWETSVA